MGSGLTLLGSYSKLNFPRSKTQFAGTSIVGNSDTWPLARLHATGMFKNFSSARISDWEKNPAFYKTILFSLMSFQFLFPASIRVQNKHMRHTPTRLSLFWTTIVQAILEKFVHLNCHKYFVNNFGTDQIHFTNILPRPSKRYIKMRSCLNQ